MMGLTIAFMTEDSLASESSLERAPTPTGEPAELVIQETDSLDGLRARTRENGAHMARALVASGRLTPDALEAMETRGLVPGRLRVLRSHRGWPRRLGGFLTHIPGPVVATEDEGERVAAFVEANHRLFDWPDVREEIEVNRVESLPGGGTLVRCSQVHRGLRVIDAEMVFHLEADGSCSHFAGFYLPALPNSTPRPTLGANDAFDAAEPRVDGLIVDGSAELVFVDPWLHGREDLAPRLAWELWVETAEPSGRRRVYVDANSGEVLSREDPTMRALARELWDLEDQSPSSLPAGYLAYRDDPAHCHRWIIVPPGVFRCDLPADGFAVLNHAETVYDYWTELSDDWVAAGGSPWTGWDGSDAPIVFNIRTGLPALVQSNNGLVGGWQGGGTGWNPCPDYTNDPLLLPGDDVVVLPSGNTSLDWVAHEMSHAFTQRTTNLQYQLQSGAVHEHLADTLAAVLDNGDWTVFEDSAWEAEEAGRLRSLRDPPLTRDGPWYNANGPVPQPDSYNDLGSGTKDAGLVHMNSGVLNKAAYLLGRLPSDPGESSDPCLPHGGVSVCGQGRTALGWMSYLTQRLYLTSTSAIEDWQESWILSAALYDLHILGDTSYPTTLAAIDALAAVGIPRPDGDTGGSAQSDARVSAAEHTVGGEERLYLWYRDATTQQIAFQYRRPSVDWSAPSLVGGGEAVAGPTAVRQWPAGMRVFFPTTQNIVHHLYVYNGTVYQEPDVPGIYTQHGVGAVALESHSINPVVLFWRDGLASGINGQILYRTVSGPTYGLPIDATTSSAPAVIEFNGRVWVIFRKMSTSSGHESIYYTSAPSTDVHYVTAYWDISKKFSDAATGINYRSAYAYRSAAAPSAGVWYPNGTLANGDPNWQVLRAYVTTVEADDRAPATPSIHMFSFWPTPSGLVQELSRTVPLGTTSAQHTGPVTWYHEHEAAYLFGVTPAGEIETWHKRGK